MPTLRLRRGGTAKRQDWGIGTKEQVYFRRSLSVSRHGEAVMSEGKSLHIRVPATGKARRPAVESLTAGTKRE